ncbi:hypothetical protein PAERUG_E15_London_28_01_14_08269 [Pseudomonas aeruginosa]|nr:hypothetical protein PAERUG_E15_London_28_01_14_08269 [Pseudomonas aeruginosa]
MGQQHQRDWQRRTSVLRLQAPLAAPNAAIARLSPTLFGQPRRSVAGQQAFQRRRLLPVGDAEGGTCRRIEVGDAAAMLDEQHQVGVRLDHFGQAPAVLLRLDPPGDIAGHADHLHHRPGVGLADRPAGGLEPAVAAVAVADTVGDGQVAVLLQRFARAQRHLAAVLGVEQRLRRTPAQFLRPVAEQGPGSRRGVEENAVEGMPGNQVGGVLGDQPVQPAGPRRLALAAQAGGGVAAARQHPCLGAVGNELPEQDAPVALRLHLAEGPRLPQAGAHQLPMVGREVSAPGLARPLAKQGKEGLVEFHRLRLAVEQQRRLRVGREERRSAGDATGGGEQRCEEQAEPVQRSALRRIAGHQQQAFVAGLQVEGEGHAMLHAGTPQARAEPGGGTPQFVQSQPAVAHQPLAQRQVAGPVRLAGARRQRRRRRHRGIGLRLRLPGQVPGLARARMFEQQTAQRTDPLDQRRALAQQAQEAVECRRSGKRTHGRKMILGTYMVFIL